MKIYRLLWLSAFLWVSITSSAQTSPNLLNGIPPQGSYDASGADTVNLMNGNLVLHIPIPVSTPQRGKLGIQYYLVVNAKTWAGQGDPNTLTGQWTPSSYCVTSQNGGPCGQTPLFVSTASFSMGRIYQKVWTDGQFPDYSVSAPEAFATWDGSGHSIGPNGMTNDGSGYQVISPEWTCTGGCDEPRDAVIIDRNGTQYSGSFLLDGPCSVDPGNGLPGSTQTTTMF